MPMTRTDLGRVAALAASAVLCACLAGIAALYVQGLFLPPSDGAAGNTLIETLSDPLVLMVWFPIVAVGACIGFVVTVFGLWDVKLTKAIPTVVLATIVSAAVMAPVFVPLSPFFGLFAGITAMNWCRRRPGRRRAMPAPPDPFALNR